MYGAPLGHAPKKLLILGAGELGKEVVLEAQRLGIETIAVDRYAGAPAMQVAHRHHVIQMTDAVALTQIVKDEQPDFIVPEIEAIATDALVALEQDGYTVIPTARATQLTMNREGIRRLAAEELGLPTARYAFADTYDEFKAAVESIGVPCVVKPIMSSSGKGQSTCKTMQDVEEAWRIARSAGRVKDQRVIVEAFVPFLSEITLLTVRSISGTRFCAPIGHRQVDGDYVESWQPHAMSDQQLRRAEEIAERITDALGGYGVFGVELFLTEDEVYFSEVSPRPHDTGLVTLVTQNLSEFALHVRAVLGFPIPEIRLVREGASRALKSSIEKTDYTISGQAQVLAYPETQLRIFGKPIATIGRRMGVVLCTADTVEQARARATEALAHLSVH